MDSGIGPNYTWLAHAQSYWLSKKVDWLSVMCARVASCLTWSMNSCTLKRVPTVAIFNHYYCARVDSVVYWWHLVWFSVQQLVMSELLYTALRWWILHVRKGRCYSSLPHTHLYPPPFSFSCRHACMTPTPTPTHIYTHFTISQHVALIRCLILID